MKKPKKWEYIVEFEPQYMENDEGEMCFAVHTVQKLVRCKDCCSYYQGLNGYCETLDTSVSYMHFCGYGKEKSSDCLHGSKSGRV